MEATNEINGHLEVPDAVRSLVSSHREIADEPLHLAMYFENPENPKDLYLLEVLENFGQNRVSDEEEIMRVSFPASADFPIDAEKRLSLILTNLPELRVALVDDWDSFRDVRGLIENSRYKVVFSDPVGEKILGELSK